MNEIDKRMLYIGIALQGLLPLLIFLINLIHYLLVRRRRETSLWYIPSHDRLGMVSNAMLAIVAVSSIARFISKAAGTVLHWAVPTWFVFLNVAAIIRRSRSQTTSA